MAPPKCENVDMAFKRLLHVSLAVAMSIPLVAHNASAITQKTSSPRPQTHHVYIIGDSLTVGPELFASLSRRVAKTKNWKSTLVNAKVGRSVPQGISVLRKAEFRTPTAIVVALGTNDVLSRPEASYHAKVIDQFMQAAKGKPVLWLNLEFSTTRRDWRSRGVRFNRELLRATTRWTNLEIADWNSFYEPKGPSRFSNDGIHLSVSGYRIRTSFLVSQMNAWSKRLRGGSTTTTSPVTTTIPLTSTTTSIEIAPTTTESPTTSTTPTTTTPTTVPGP